MDPQKPRIVHLHNDLFSYVQTLTFITSVILSLTFLPVVTSEVSHVYVHHMTAVEWLHTSKDSIIDLDPTLTFPAGDLGNFTCVLHDLRNNASLATGTLNSTGSTSIYHVTGAEIDKMVDRCVTRHSTLVTSYITRPMTSSHHGHRSKRGIFDLARGIFPGTKWCGRYNIASNTSHLGQYRHTDACCRQHDQCPDFVLARSWGWGVFNPLHFTVCSCECDERFRSCLQAVNSLVSNLLGHLFFDVGRPPCLAPDTRAFANGIPRAVLVTSKRYRKSGVLAQLEGLVEGRITLTQWLAGLPG